MREVPISNCVDLHYEKRSRAASRIQNPLMRVSGVANFVQNMVCKPIWRIVLSQIVSYRLREKLLVQLLQEVTRFGRVFRECSWVILIQLYDHLTSKFVYRLVPNREIPREQIPFQKIGDAHIMKDPSPLKLFELSLQLRWRYCIQEFLDLTGHPRVKKAHYFSGEQLN